MRQKPSILFDAIKTASPACYAATRKVPLIEPIRAGLTGFKWVMRIYIDSKLGNIHAMEQALLLVYYPD